MSYYRFLDRVSGRLGHFSKDTDGAIAAFSVVTFLTMFLAVGMATDFMRHEAQRAELQDALDRGVLAAAMSNTEAEAGAAVAGYLRAANFISSDANLDVDPDFGLVSKRVNATIEYPINTFFLKLAGIPQLNVVARSSAATSKSKIEISLALDISGSMSREDTAVDQATFIGMNPDAPNTLDTSGNVKRLDFMKVAAKEFVDLMLTGSSASDTTINLIPFAGQVNPGAYVMGKMTPARVHGYSSCIDADTTELLGGDLTNMGTARQTPHFQYFRFEADYGHNAEWGWCPSDTQAIEYMSNNASRLKDRIEDFVAHDGTGIPIAMSWALGLLRPNAQPLIADLADQNMVEDRFANRPLPMGGNDTMKVIVLMSDGRTTQQMRPMAWAYDEQHEIEDLAENYMSNAEEMISVADARTHLDALCNSAKGQKVVVFTVGFDLSGTDYALDDLRDCASGIGHFYNVNGVELSEAFEAIATTITKLRLVY